MEHPKFKSTGGFYRADGSSGIYNTKLPTGVQVSRHLKFKAWVKDKVKDAFSKALDREMVKAWVKALFKAVQNVY